MADKKHALYLVNSDTGRVELIHGDDVEDKLANGYEKPTGMKANGTEWNAEEDLVQQDAAAEFAKAQAKADAEKAQKKAEELEKAQKASDKAAADAKK